MTVSQRTNVDALAEALLLDQDRKPRIKAFLRVRSERTQHFEDVLWDIYIHRFLDSATGYDLDRFGAIVGEPRLGRSDTRYRLWIKARGRANRSAGRVNDLLEVLRLVLGPDAVIMYEEIPDRDAEVRMTIIAATSEMDQVARILRSIIGAGIRLDVTGSPFPPEQTFSFAADAAGNPGPGLGLNLGHFAGIL